MSNDGFNIRADLLPEPIIDRDPLDETQHHTNAIQISSYRATYERIHPLGLFHRDFIAQSFLDAVEAAADAREDGERLLNVRAQSTLDPIQLNHG